MSRIKDDRRGGWKEIRPGQRYVHRGHVDNLEVSPGHKVTIFDEASQGAVTAAPPFNAGDYQEAWRYRRHGRNSMREDKGKLVLVETTPVQPEMLLELIWYEDRKRCVQRLEPGEYEISNRGDEWFRNDTITEVKLPPNATVALYENEGMGGRFIELDMPKIHRLSQFKLDRRISSVVYELDDWKEVKRAPGKTFNRSKIGEPIIRKWRVVGLPGDETDEWIDFGFATSKEERWDVSATIGISQTIKAGGLGIESETKIEASTTAGGGGSTGTGRTENAGTTVHAKVRDSGVATGSIIIQRMDVQSEIVVTLKNQRTGKELKQKKIELAHDYTSETVFDD